MDMRLGDNKPVVAIASPDIILEHCAELLTEW